MLFQHFKTALCIEEGGMLINQHSFAPSNHPNIPWLIGGVPQIDTVYLLTSQSPQLLKVTSVAAELKTWQ